MAACCGCWRDLATELRGRSGSDAGRWRDFFSESWLINNRRAYLAVRLINALFIDAVVIGSVFDEPKAKWVFWQVYLTHWTLIIVALYLTAAAAATAYTQYAKAPKESAAAAPSSKGVAPDDPVPPWVLLIHALYAIALPCSLLVTALFWLLVYPGDPGSATRAMAYFVHGGNFFSMLVDVVINQQPFYFIYIFFSFFLYAVIYICFTIVFWGANGTVSSRPYIYSSIDWSTRTSAASGGILSGVIVVIIVPALGCICWTTVQAKKKKALGAVVAVAGADKSVVAPPAECSQETV